MALLDDKHKVVQRVSGLFLPLNSKTNASPWTGFQASFSYFPGVFPWTWKGVLLHLLLSAEGSGLATLHDLQQWLSTRKKWTIWNTCRQNRSIWGSIASWGHDRQPGSTGTGLCSCWEAWCWSVLACTNAPLALSSLHKWIKPASPFSLVSSMDSAQAAIGVIVQTSIAPKAPSAVLPLSRPELCQSSWVLGSRMCRNYSEQSCAIS